MSPRRARRKDPFDRGRRGDSASRPPPVPITGFPAGMDRVEEWPDGEWKVRALRGGAADRAYRCPGCDQEVRAGMPHIVSWPNWPGGEEERRHWHTPCWRKRLDRGHGRNRY
ncbi:ATP/GTP-binding protein [Spongiactinospora gelatinilytica]|uniref:ATP/GTP-binding protein n=1 Tax=Spongiactinospora gelatinilytica TaxID=2666298 RepID=A0A2W2GPX0_9ACTN|nr:ATP/GTP-binding protein [Spongiactinospora gelatinilytica]PZG44679.1 ATP/GTP-binding protein [Spongiactinospora gelatinilytica]